VLLFTATGQRTAAPNKEMQLEIAKVLSGNRLIASPNY